MADTVCAVERVLGGGGSRWVPEVRPVRFVDAGSWADLASFRISMRGKCRVCWGAYYIRTAKLLLRNFKHMSQVIPFDNVRLDEDCPGLVAIFRRMLVHQLLRF